MSPGTKCVLLICAIAIAAVAAVFLIRPTSFTPPPPKPTIASELAKIRASGAPVHILELAGRPVPDARNAAPIYEKAFKELEGLPQGDLDIIARFVSREDRKKDPTLWSKARAALFHCRRAESLVEQAAARPECKFKRDWKKGALEVAFPQFRHLRDMARVLAADAILSAKDGHPERALHLVKVGLKVSESLQNERTIIGALVMVVTLKMSLLALEQTTLMCEISERQAYDTYSELARIDLKLHFVHAMEGERVMGLWMFEQARLGRHGIVSPLDIDGDELYFLLESARQIEACRLPYRVVHRRGLDKYTDPPRYAIISVLALPVTGGLIVSRDSAEARVALAQTALALRAHRKRYGGYPATINELRSKLHWTIPKDPFSGKDLIYRKTSTGYTLYSIGRDLTDDGGAPDKMDQGDIVWGQLR